MTDQPAGARVRTFPGLCQGWGQCHRWAPDVYVLDDNGHIDVHVVDVPADRVADARLGASACPAHAIIVIDG